MTSYSKFDVEIYSEELFPVTEMEYESVMREMAEERDALQGYQQWIGSLDDSERRAVVEQDGGVTI